ncbi:MAG: HAD family hydrolase [Chthoniobacterales bacterium]
MKALIFDLDGTLVDTVYPHVFTWQATFAEAGIPVEGWRIHRRVGMSGGVFIRSLMRECGYEISEQQTNALTKRHLEMYKEMHPVRQLLPGAKDLLKFLRENKIIHGIATSGSEEEIGPSLKALEVPDDMVVVCKKDGGRPKPEPDLFLTCQKKLKVKKEECYAVGDSTWDILSARRAGMLGVGITTGGYDDEELIGAGAFRVYPDTKTFHRSLEELGFEMR